jgi:hypothetical protein
MLELFADDPEVINTHLLKCEYRREVIEHYFKNYWRQEYDNFKIEKSANGEIKTGFDDSSLFFTMPEYGFSVKSPAYSSEAEWRLCTNEWRHFQFRTRGNLIVPFIEHKFDKSIVKKIVIGPSLNSLQVEKGLNFFLKKSGFSDISCAVETSKISYRQV